MDTLSSISKLVAPGCAASAISFIDGSPSLKLATMKSLNPLALSFTVDPKLKKGDRLLVVVQHENQVARVDAEVLQSKRFASHWEVELSHFLWQSSDRRRGTRVEVVLPAIIRYINEANGEPEYENFTAECTDLSEAGCWISTEDSPPIGSLIEWSLRLPNGSTIQGIGVVARTSTTPNGMGVEFVEYRKHARALLREFVYGRAA